MVDELQCPLFLFLPPTNLLFLSPSLCPHVPPLHLLVRWKIGETLFSPFPITRNRPGLLKWPLLHLYIRIEPRIYPWEKFNVLFWSYFLIEIFYIIYIYPLLSKHSPIVDSTGSLKSDFPATELELTFKFWINHNNTQNNWLKFKQR